MLDIQTSTDMLIRQLMWVDMVIGGTIVVSILIGVYFMSKLSDAIASATANMGTLNTTVGQVAAAITNLQNSSFTDQDVSGVIALADSAKAANNQLAPLVGGTVIP